MHVLNGQRSSNGNSKVLCHHRRTTEELLQTFYIKSTADILEAFRGHQRVCGYADIQGTSRNLLHFKKKPVPRPRHEYAQLYLF
jgi:hypothetical protein